MFKEMRRKRQLLSKEECINILSKSSYGVLGLNGKDGYPYTVPLNYVLFNNSLYIHGAKEGYKIDLIKNNNSVTFCVVGEENIIQSEFTSYYKSVMVFGKAYIVDDENEKRLAIDELAKKYSPNESDDSRFQEINKSFSNLNIIKIEIDDMSGKQSIELVNK